MGVQAMMAPKEQSSGLGGLGKLLGLAGGALATLATGGAAAPLLGVGINGAAAASALPSLGTIAGGALTGSSIGGTLGGIVDPGKSGSSGQKQQVTDDPGLRRLQSGEFQGQMKALQDGAMAATQLPPDQQAQHLDPIMKAANILSQNQKQQGQY